jgi:hypothetical protein
MRLEVEVLDGDLDSERLDETTTKLARQLRELDVGGVSRSRSGAAPAGARGNAFEVATLLVTLADSRALSAVVSTVRGWLASAPTARRRARLRVGEDELEVDGLSSTEQRELIAAWLDRHRAA